jgi:hypothetical protein
MDHAALDRIVQRLCLELGGSAEPVGELGWDIVLPEDPEQEDGPKISFRDQFVVEDGRITSLESDAPMDKVGPAQQQMLRELHQALANALRLESTGFASFDDVAKFLVAELEASVEDDTVEIPAREEGGEPVYVSEVPVAREPWVSLSVAFDDDTDPEWLLEMNGNLSHVHFESFDGSVTLATAFPRALLTGQRLLELVDDLVSYREEMLAEMEGEDDEEDDVD